MCAEIVDLASRLASAAACAQDLEDDGPRAEIPSRFARPLLNGPDPADKGLVAVGRLAIALAAWMDRTRMCDADADRAGELLAAMDDFIANTPAHTLKGVIVKLTALRRCEGYDEPSEEPPGGSVWSGALIDSALAALRTCIRERGRR